MLPSLSRGLRVALVLALSVGYVEWHVHTAFANTNANASTKDDSAGGDDDDDGGGDDDAKGDKGGGGDDDDDTTEDDKDQPPVTAGGLFTIRSYPVNETLRPLTMTEHVTQLRLSLGTDLSAKGAFGSVGVNLEGSYGYSDNFSLIGGLTDAYNFKQFGFYFGFEAALAYDLLDFRVDANIHRFAYPKFCNNGDADQPLTCDSSSDGLPDGNYTAGGTQFSIDIGFPFRYSFTKQIAIVALQTLMSIDFNGSQRGTDAQVAAATAMGLPAYCSGVGTDMNGDPVLANTAACIENGAKPDLNPSVGVAFNPVPPLSVVVFGQLRIPDFDTSAGNFRIPVTARVEFSPNQQFDIGLEFTLLNIMPPDPQSAIDNRFLSAYVQARY